MAMEFKSNIARKSAPPSLLAVEVEKTKRASEIGKKSGLFYVPEIVNFDSEKGILDFERLDDIVTLADLIINGDSRIFEILKKAGRALAVIHDQLVLPDELKINLPKKWQEDSTENVFIHGDLSLRNLCFRKSIGVLVILDWSAAPLVGRCATVGPRLFDIMSLVSYLFYSVPKRKFFGYQSSRMANVFLKGYMEGNHNLDYKFLQKVKKLLPEYYWRNVWYQTKHQISRKMFLYLSYEAVLYIRTLCYRPRVHP
ncbi:MAG: aminoglycoside phosphotransferase family protein [Pseudomonadota bacterium]